MSTALVKSLVKMSWLNRLFSSLGSLFVCKKNPESVTKWQGHLLLFWTAKKMSSLQYAIQMFNNAFEQNYIQNWTRTSDGVLPIQKNFRSRTKFCQCHFARVCLSWQSYIGVKDKFDFASTSAPSLMRVANTSIFPNGKRQHRSHNCIANGEALSLSYKRLLCVKPAQGDNSRTEYNFSNVVILSWRRKSMWQCGNVAMWQCDNVAMFKTANCTTFY